MESKRFSARTSLLISSVVFLGGLLEVGKNVVIAFRYGSGPETDAFFTAFLIPNTYSVFWSSACLVGLVPLLAVWTVEDTLESRRLIGSVFLLSAAMALVLTLSAYAASPAIVRVLAPGFAAAQKAKTAALFNRMIPLLLLSGVGGTVAAVLNSRHDFLLPVANKAITNTVVVVGLLLFFLPGTTTGWLATLVVAGAALHASLLLFRMRPLEVRLLGLWKLDRGRLGAIVIAILIPFLALAVRQISALVERIIGSYLAAGSISALTYSYQLVMGAGTVVSSGVNLPLIPSLAKQGSPADKIELLWQGLYYLLVLVLPLGCGIYLLAGPLVSVLFLRGAFTGADAIRTAEVIGAYAFGLVFSSLVAHLQTVYWADRKYKLLIVQLALVTLVNVLVDVPLGFAFGAWGLAAGFTLASAASCASMIWLIERDYGRLLSVGRLSVLVKPAAVTAIMATAMLAARGPASYFSSTLFGYGTSTEAFSRLCLLSGVGLVVFSAAGLAGGLEPLPSLARSVLRRVSNSAAIAR